MRVLLYEFVTGGGWFSVDCDEPPPQSLQVEGAAMRAALVRDFAAVPGVEASYFHDERLPVPDLPGRAIPIRSPQQEREELLRAAEAAVGILLIAPEFDELLLSRCRLVEEAGGELLSADSRFVALAGDKHATATRLALAGVPVPLGDAFSAREPLPAAASFPAVLKPHDGAGSLHVQRVEDVAAAREHVARNPAVQRWRIEAFCPGLAASIAAFGGPQGWLLLPPGRQLLSAEGEFHYLGGEFPLPPALAARAERLARRALAALPLTRGYVGLDLVLGPAADGSQDVVLEVNPRPTTSYVGLRRLLRENLAAAWLAWLRGERTELHATPRGVRFDAAGHIE